MLRKLHIAFGIIIAVLAALDAVIVQMINQGYRC